MDLLTSFSNPRIKALAALADKKGRAESGLFLIEGPEFIGRAVKGGWEIDTLLVAENNEALVEGLEVVHLAKHVIVTTLAVLGRVTGKDNPQPVVAAVKQKWGGLGKAKGLWVALERVRDPGNLGTILRTCEAAGVEGVLLVGDCTDPFGPEAVRASMGSVLGIPVVKTDVGGLLVWAKDEAVTLYGTRMAGSVDYRDVLVKRPAVVVMGNESEGLSDQIAAACAQVVRIPMTGGVESLNVAAAAAVIVFGWMAR
jgi:TrmH family RNA methyltransferase